MKLKWTLPVLLLSCAAVNTRATESESSCKSVHASLREQQATAGCPSTFCATGEIDGNHGLNGTTRFVLDSSAPAPATAPIVSRSYSGIFEIVAADGTLTLRETGINTPRPAGGRMLSSVAPVINGTGRFAGATGTIFFNGINPTPGVFQTDVSGELCLVQASDR